MYKMLKALWVVQRSVVIFVMATTILFVIQYDSLNKKESLKKFLLFANEGKASFNL